MIVPRTKHPGKYKSLIFLLLIMLATAFAMAGRSLFSGKWENPGLEFNGTGAVAPDTTKTGASAADSAFNALVKKGDEFFQQKKYDEALKTYQDALRTKPNDYYLKGKVGQIIGIKAELARTEKDYTAAINSANDYLAKQDYLNAKSAYQLALTIRPNDEYATSKMNEVLGLLRSQKAKNILYDVTIDSAEKLFAAKEYEKAKEQYENALKILPNEKYPRDRINAIIKIQVDIQTREEMYAKTIASADKYYNAKNWPSALTDYRKSLTYKDDQQYPKDRIKELEELLGIQKEKDDAYDKAIAAADKMFDAGTYENARTGYQEASKIKPDEVYPKKRIQEINDILSGRARMANDYQRLIDAADSLYIAKNYLVAKLNYQQALKVKPGESYPKEMITKSDQMLAGQEANAKQLEEAYQQAIASGDKSFAAKDYSTARSEYQNAISLKPGEKYPQDKLSQIDGIEAALARQKADDDLYQSTITAADKLLADKAYDQAKATYNKAIQIKPAEKYPKDQIALIDKTLSDIAASNAKEKQYQDLIASADKFFSGKDYPQAKSQYQLALAVKPDETYPKDRIAAIDKIFADAEQKKAEEEARFKALVAGGDSLFELKQYEPAKSSYQDALTMKPYDTYSKSKVNEIDAILVGIAKQKSLDDQYNKAISEGNRLFEAKTYEPAKVQYQEALKLKPAEQYPKDRISAIDAALAELARISALNDQYSAAIKKADGLFNGGTWDLARAEYVNASGIKPEETYPKDKISAIDKILRDLADKKATDENYSAAIAKADKLLADKNYPDARSSYQEAGGIKPEEAYPKNQIAVIDKILADIADQKAKDEMYAAGIARADKLLADKNYEAAKTEYQGTLVIKPAEAYPKTKIAEIDGILDGIAKQKALNEQYTGLIAEADKLLTDKSYDASKAKYQAALAIKPDEKYPKDKIIEIDQALAEIARLKGIDDQYASAIAAADKLFLEKSWDLAKTGYLEAGKIKPAEKYPKDRIAEINKILADIAAQKALDDKYAGIIAGADKLFAAKTYDDARKEYTNALNLKPAEQYPKDRLAEIDKIFADIAKQKEIDDSYKTTLAKADQLYVSKNYAEARTEYTNAVNLKPAEEYPKTRIAAIDRIFADQKALDDAYAASIAAADKLFNDGSFTEAKAEYLNAQKIKPAEKYPKDRVAEADKKLAEIARQKSIDDQYNASISKADKYLADKSYQQARAEYNTAQGIKPGDSYPKDKIAEIDEILAEIKAKNDAYSASIAKADQLFVAKNWEEARTEYGNASQMKPEEAYPRNKISEINKTLAEIKGKKQTFDDLVAKGDAQFTAKDYYGSKDLFQQALTLFPEEAYPKSRIARINAVVDSIYRVNKVFYDKAIAEGDKNFNAFIFDKAIDSYNEALGFLPMESYPKEMISKIKKIITENAIVDVMKTTMVIPAGTEKQFPFSPVNMASRKNNYFYIKIRNLTDKEFNVLVRYGKDKQINGGAVLKSLAGDGKTYDRLISVRGQDPWYREDNNWIGLVPQGGDVEVTFIQISRSQ